METNGSVKEIAKFSANLVKMGRFKIKLFSKQLTYFRNRYTECGRFSHYFRGLNLRPNDNENLVKAVLLGNATDAESIVTVLLIIVFRYRNNLHHGLKWAYDLKGQLENFNAANDVLVSAMNIVNGLH